MLSSAAAPLALIALITPPPSATERKTLNCDSRKMSARSTSSRPKRVSGLSRAEAVHRLGVGHARERRRDVDAARFLENADEQAFDERLDFLVGDERRLDVDLRELRLAVGAQILVAEAAGDLEILLQPGDLQQLLVLLRRLRQRVERCRASAATARGNRARLRASGSKGSASRFRGSPSRRDNRASLSRCDGAASGSLHVAPCAGRGSDIRGAGLR